MTLAPRAAIIVMILCGALAGAAACGGRVSPPQGSTTTSSAATADAEATAALSAGQDYREALTAWVETHWFDADGQPVKGPRIADFADPTHAEIAAARQFAAGMREALVELKAIAPPDEIAEAHAQYCAAFSGELAALDRMITAIEYGNARDAELAMRGLDEAHALEIRALKVLGPYIDEPGLTQS